MNSHTLRLRPYCKTIKNITIAIVPSISLFLMSCMHWGMMRSGAEDRPPKGSVLVKEITVANVKASAIFPQAGRDTETLFTLKLIDTGSGEPFSGATVFFHVQFHHDTGDTMANMHMMHAETDSTRVQQMGDRGTDVVQEVQETSEPGVYSVAFTPTQGGNYTFGFRVAAVPGQNLGQDILVEAAAVVRSDDVMGHSGMMHGNDGAFGYMLIGAAIMGAMMLVVVVARGRMF